MSIESVMSSNHLILCRPLLLLPSVFPSIRVFSLESVLHIRWPKYWSFSIGPSNEYSGLTSFRMDWLDLLACSPRDSQESSPTPQLKSICSLVLSLLYGPTLTPIHDYWKNQSFDYMDQKDVLFIIRDWNAKVGYQEIPGVTGKFWPRSTKWSSAKANRVSPREWSPGFTGIWIPVLSWCSPSLSSHIHRMGLNGP